MSTAPLWVTPVYIVEVQLLGNTFVRIGSYNALASSQNALALLGVNALALAGVNALEFLYFPHFLGITFIIL